MPCRDYYASCSCCKEDPCVCHELGCKPAFDVEGALCDVLTLLEEKHTVAYYEIDTAIHDWWHAHEGKEKERIKAEALAKLTPRERRALGLK